MLKNRKTRAWVAGGLGFFLTITLFITVGGMELFLGLFSNVTLRRCVRESNYAERAYDEFSERTVDLLKTNGITIDCNAVIPQKDVLFAFSNYEEAIYNHKQPKSNMENIRGSIEVAMWEYLVENGIAVTDSMRQGIERNSKAVSEIYEQYLEPEFLKNIHEYLYARRNGVKYAVFIGAGLSIIIFVLLLCLFHHKHKAIRYVISASLATAIWNIILTIIVSLQLNVEKMGVASVSYEYFLNEYTVAIRVPFFIVSAMLVLASAMLFYLMNRLRHQG